MPPLAAHDDAWIQREIVAELALDPALAGKEIGVSVRGGVATLSGGVDTTEQHATALRLALKIPEVKSVADELRVLPAGANRTDTELAHAVVKALEWEATLPLGIRTRVDEGHVWLEGSVETDVQRQAAERAVGFVTGVQGVTNNLTLRSG